MVLNFVFFTILLWWSAAGLALTIPYNAQSPLMVKSQPHKSFPARVILAFTKDGSKEVHHAELPLRTPLPSGVTLPANPDKMNIATVVNQKGSAVSMKDLGKIMCRVLPKFSPEEKAAMAAADVEKVWPWFSIRDEAVLFQEGSSRWYLGGRAVESYECR